METTFSFFLLLITAQLFWSCPLRELRISGLPAATHKNIVNVAAVGVRRMRASGFNSITHIYSNNGPIVRPVVQRMNHKPDIEAIL